MHITGQRVQSSASVAWASNTAGNPGGSLSWRTQPGGEGVDGLRFVLTATLLG